jgi:hypothetical protein
MEGKVLESVNNNPYLGVELSSTLSWDTHIGNILTKVFGIHTAKFRLPVFDGPYKEAVFPLIAS